MLSDKRQYQLLYFVFYASANGFIAFRNVYFEELGLTGGQMGLLGAVLVVAGMIAQPIWGVVADRYAAGKRVLLVAAAASGVIVLAYPFAGGFPEPFLLLAVATALLAAVRSPIMPIANSMVLSGGLNYGQVRAFGSIAFGIGVLGIGWALDRLPTDLIFYVYAAGMVVFVAIVVGVPEPDADLTPDLQRDAVGLLTDRRFLVLLIVATVIGGISSAGSAYFSVYVRAIGSSDGLTGTAWMLKTVAEAAVFLSMARIGLSNPTKLTLGAVVYIGVYFVYAAVATPTAILAVQPFLGVGLALFYLAVVNFAHEFAPPELSSTAQTLLFSFGIGTGRALGQLGAGGLMDLVGVQSMYYFLAAGGAVAVAVSLYFHGPAVRRLGAAVGTSR
ncbi:MFS transporter [Halomicrobium urmianum]|uniref:MFS transporter n=1 Tax=Halomicrobium urmianum TaxID=1586233 RepID=UPI001CD991F9|nr:MFS transporter [Halomicrobium urmianum]